MMSLPVRVYIEDTDAGGIVYHANYLKYMERCRTEFFRGLGYDKPAILEGGGLLVIASAQLSYRRPAVLDDSLFITCKIQKLARSYADFVQQVMRGDELLCEGVIRVACVASATMKPCALPQDIHSQLDHVFRL